MKLNAVQRDIIAHLKEGGILKQHRKVKDCWWGTWQDCDESHLPDKAVTGLIEAGMIRQTLQAERWIEWELTNEEETNIQSG
jgi:hypothetical protein